MTLSSKLPLPSERSWTHALWVPVLTGGIIMGLALGVRHVQGLFLLPMTLDLEQRGRRVRSRHKAC